MPQWHSSWSRMRGLGRGRSWLTWGEFQGMLATLIGVTLSPYHVRRATRTCPPARVHGRKRYQDCHVQMAIGYAKAKGLIQTTQEATA